MLAFIEHLLSPMHCTKHFTFITLNILQLFLFFFLSLGVSIPALLVLVACEWKSLRRVV